MMRAPIPETDADSPHRFSSAMASSIL